MRPDFPIGVVGPCGSGKTTLVCGLRDDGFFGKVIAQEHSYVPDMWLRITKPHILVYLDVSYTSSMVRKKFNWTEKEFQAQIFRLRHAYKHADIIFQTNDLSVKEVLNLTIFFLEDNNVVRQYL